MTYRGIFKNGVVVLRPEAQLPDGTAVEVSPAELGAGDDPFLAAVQQASKLRTHWPRDYARNLDHLGKG